MKKPIKLGLLSQTGSRVTLSFVYKTSPCDNETFGAAFVQQTFQYEFSSAVAAICSSPRILLTAVGAVTARFLIPGNYFSSHKIFTLAAQNTYAGLRLTTSPKRWDDDYDDNASINTGMLLHLVVFCNFVYLMTPYQLKWLHNVRGRLIC